MSSPSTALATLRPDLGGSFEEFNLAADRAGFIGYQVCVPIDVQVPSGAYGRISLEDLLKNPEVDRASTGRYNETTWNFDDESFSTKERGLEARVDQRNSRIYANYFDAEAIAAELARDGVLRAAEKRIADLIFNATTWAGAALTTAVTNEWDDAANAEPISDVEAAVQKVYDGSGVWPNALIINRKVFRNLRNCAEIIDRIASSGAGGPTKASDITVAMLAAVFDLKYILVAGGSRNTANEGQAASIGQVWSGEYAMVCKIAETQSIIEPCVARTFHYSADGSEIGGMMESYADPARRGDIVRSRHEVQEKVMYAQLGHLLSNITT